MTLSAIRPASFPWFPYDGFTFCLGLAEGEAAWTSGHTSAAYDAAVGKMTVGGTMAEQARTAYEKVLTILAAAGFGPGDVTRITENVTIAGLDDYAAAEAVRRELFGAHRPVLRTVVVDRLIRRTALLEVELHAVAGGGAELLAASEPRPAGAWRPSPVREGHDGAVYLPTVVPVDAAGEVVHPGDLVGQYAWCLDRAGELLSAVGLSLDAAVTTYDYTTPATRDVYRRTHRVRKERLGGAGVFPGAGGILMSRLHHPDALVALDVTASRHPLELVNPGWSRYDTLTYTPGVQGRPHAVHVGLRRARPGHPGGAAPGRRRRAGGGDVRRDPGAACRTPGSAPRTSSRPPSTASRRRCPTTARSPACASACCRRPGRPRPARSAPALLRPEFLIEVFPTAVYPR